MVINIRIVILRADEGKITSKEVVEKPYEDVAKDVATKALKEWNPQNSDFTAIRTKFEVRYKLPINPELYDALQELNLEMFREGNELVVNIPVLTISFDNAWLGDSYLDKRMYLIAPYIDEDSVKQLEEYLADATKEPKKIEQQAPELTLGEEELQRLEEGLAELEEKPRKGRKRKRKSK